MPWRVDVELPGGNGWDYPSSHFPQVVQCKEDACRLVEDIRRKGGRGVTMEWIRRLPPSHTPEELERIRERLRQLPPLSLDDFPELRDRLEDG